LTILKLKSQPIEGTIGKDIAPCVHFFKPSNLGKEKRYNKRERNRFKRYLLYQSIFKNAFLSYPFVFSTYKERFETYEREQYFCH